MTPNTTQRHLLPLRGRKRRPWLWEAVPYEGELVAIKQVEVDPSGTMSRYWWQRMKDQRGFLIDPPPYPEEAGFARISAEEFRHHWTTQSSPTSTAVVAATPALQPRPARKPAKAERALGAGRGR